MPETKALRYKDRTPIGAVREGGTVVDTPGSYRRVVKNGERWELAPGEKMLGRRYESGDRLSGGPETHYERCG